jgi:hypothetical protein
MEALLRSVVYAGEDCSLPGRQFLAVRYVTTINPATRKALSFPITGSPDHPIVDSTSPFVTSQIVIQATQWRRS